LWRIPLGLERLPQRIEVVFNGPLAVADALGQRFVAPALEGLPVDRTLWTVAGPSSLRFAGAENAVPTELSDHHWARLLSAAEIIEAGSLMLTGESRETQAWYVPWLDRMATARTGLMHHLAAAPPDEPAERLKKDLKVLDERQSAIARALGEADLFAEHSSDPPTAADAADLWTWSLGPHQSIERFAFRGGGSTLTLNYRRAQPGRIGSALLTIFGLAVSVGLLLWGLQRATLTELLKRWPGALGVAVGLGWWLWLSPSILGWGIVLASLAASIWPGWKYLRPTDGSSVSRLRVPTRERPSSRGPIATIE